MAEIRVAIVEDEPPARAQLRRMLGEHLGYRVVAEADDVAGGLGSLRNEKPDLVFLDIQLGAKSGFDLLMRAAPPYPLIVFTTAFHEHAPRAFEFAALDYLLKSFDRERFARCLTRVGERITERRESKGAVDEERLRRLGADLGHTPRLQRIVVHERGRSRSLRSPMCGASARPVITSKSTPRRNDILCARCCRASRNALIQPNSCAYTAHTWSERISSRKSHRGRMAISS